MRKYLTLITASFLFLLTSHAFANGALAIDGNQGDQYGFSYNYPSSSAAQQSALNECGGGCYIVKTFSNGCAAYAADQANGSTIYGWATASTSGQAKNSALSYCRNNGGTQCLVRSWGCNSN